MKVSVEFPPFYRKLWVYMHWNKTKFEWNSSLTPVLPHEYRWENKTCYVDPLYLLSFVTRPRPYTGEGVKFEKGKHGKKSKSAEGAPHLA